MSGIDVIQAITSRSLCCACLERMTGLSSVAVRGALLAASRRVRLNTWTPCQSCGALDETYRIAALDAPEGQNHDGRPQAAA